MMLACLAGHSVDTHPGFQDAYDWPLLRAGKPRHVSIGGNGFRLVSSRVPNQPYSKIELVFSRSGKRILLREATYGAMVRVFIRGKACSVGVSFSDASVLEFVWAEVDLRSENVVQAYDSFRGHLYVSRALPFRAFQEVDAKMARWWGIYSGTAADSQMVRRPVLFRKGSLIEGDWTTLEPSNPQFSD